MPVILFGGRYLGLAPDAISGLKLWLKADAEVYEDAGGTDPAEDADAVEVWGDQSGLSRDFVDGGAGAQPTYKTSILNGQPVLRFDNSSDYMVKSGQTYTDYTAVNAATIFVVLSTASAPAGVQNLFAMFDTGAANYKRRLYVDGSNFAAEHYDGSVDVATKAYASGSQILTYKHDGANVSIGLNDTRDASLTSTASGSTSFSGVVDLYVRNIPAAAVSTDIAEVVVYNAVLTEQNRKDVETFLAIKYGITLPY